MPIQMQASAAIGVPAHKIIVRVKRIGGGFGGKNEQSAIASWPAIVAARKYSNPLQYCNISFRSSDFPCIQVSSSSKARFDQTGGYDSNREATTFCRQIQSTQPFHPQCVL